MYIYYELHKITITTVSRVPKGGAMAAWLDVLTWNSTGHPQKEVYESSGKDWNTPFQ